MTTPKSWWPPIKEIGQQVKTVYNIKDGPAKQFLKGIQPGDMFIYNHHNYDPATGDLINIEQIPFVVLEKDESNSTDEAYFPEYKIFWTDTQHIMTIDSIDMVQYATPKKLDELADECEINFLENYLEGTLIKD